MKRIFTAIAILVLTGTAMADSIHCSKSTKGSDGSLIEKTYLVPVVNGNALINVNSIGSDGRNQQDDRFVAMGMVQNGIVTLVRVIDRMDNTHAEIYSEANMIALQRGSFKGTVACGITQ